jgi:O-antigen ligase
VLRRTRRLALAAGLVALVALAVAAHPVARFEAFKKPPPSLSQPLSHPGSNPVQQHLLSGGSTGRWQEWASAVDEWKTKPINGRGAGAFEAWWAEHGSLPGFIQNAHSLYLETLGDLGVVGLCLIVFAFGAGLAIAFRRWRTSRGDDRTTIAALGATFLAYAVAAGIDWMWQLTAVSVVAMIVLGLLAGGATTRPREAVAMRGARWPLRLSLVVVGSTVIVLLAIPLLAELKIERSQQAVGRGDAETAAAQALSARKIEPWAATPYLQLALVTEQVGDLAAARRWIRGAISRDPTDWHLWLAQARIETKSGLIRRARASLNKAISLNPRSPLFTDLRGHV